MALGFERLTPSLRKVVRGPTVAIAAGRLPGGAHDESAEWACEVMHDSVWFSFELLEALEWLISIADELTGEEAALKELGAGPLEDLLGGDPATMDRALEATRSTQLPWDARA